MRPLFCKRHFSGLILAAMSAGSWTLPAAARQATQASAKTAHGQPAGTNSHSSSSSTAKKPTKSSSHKSSSRRKSKRVKGQTAPTPQRISEIQEALANKGAFTGAPSGKWDDSTVQALSKFQVANGLTPTGKLDALTLQKLGLGSETAGLAPPTPPPNSTNRLRSTTSLPEEPRD
ncbi:MAG TPA: peptidoglycan-binding domain-containing protein [Candidatus Sulfotelmatobacter sp.]|nr:peptidoglycan-binding domain-containing protein [Candidatus Sulfotelmatobacter sp.]